MGLTHVLPVDPSFVVELELMHNVIVTEADSGQEQRYQKWAGPKRHWRLNTNAMTAAELESLRDFWLARNGPVDPFIFLPPTNLDRLLKGVACGTGNGSQTVFNIGNSATPRTYLKLYTGAGHRNVVYKDAVAQGSGFTLANDDNNKLSTVTFDVAPANGVVITVDIDRYQVVRFVKSEFRLALEHYGIGSAPEYELIEVLRSSI